MDSGGQKEPVTGSSLLHGVLGVQVDGRLTKGKGAFQASLLLHAIGCHPVILVDSLPVTVGHLPVKCSDTSGETLGEPECKLDMGCTVNAALQLSDCVGAAEGLMDAL